VKRRAAWSRLAKLSWVVLASRALVASEASADVTVWKSEKGDDGWEVFTNGRAGAFFSWAKGDGEPQATTFDPNTDVKLHTVLVEGQGLQTSDVQQYTLPNPDGTPSHRTQSFINATRIRSGMMGSVLGIGLRRNLDATTKLTGYFSLVSIVDSPSQRKFFPDFPNAREGYVKIEGTWGSFLAGRAATLFDRGAYDTDVLYLHGYGVGFPVDLQSSRSLPTAGQVGFGILPNGYAAGLVYATPTVAGIQLSAGVYDPASFAGPVQRTKLFRPEFELTADEPLGTIGKLHLYVNGTTQTNYRPGSTDENSVTASGVGFGGRVELGPVHLAAGGHTGKGIGFRYFGDSDSAVMNANGDLRSAQGYFAMAQLALLDGKLDLDGGYGMSSAKVLQSDLMSSSMNPINPATGFPDPESSWIKSQSAISAAVVYSPVEWLHFDLDVMFTTFKWSLGEEQKVNIYNAGTTLTW
jgi:predicted porin